MRPLHSHCNVPAYTLVSEASSHGFSVCFLADNMLTAADPLSQHALEVQVGPKMPPCMVPCVVPCTRGTLPNHRFFRFAVDKDVLFLLTPAG